MTRGPSPVGLLALAFAGFVASSGCNQPHAAFVAASATTAEPAPPAVGDPTNVPAGEKKDPDATAFRFPDDAGGTLLSKVLPPADVKGPLVDPGAGPRRPSPGGLDAPPPSPPPRTSPPAPPSPPERPRKALAPRLATEETLGPARGDPVPPAPRSFYVADRIRLPSVDANEPPPLPILSPQATPDRASLDSPTADMSAEAALAAPMPQRTKPAPYVRITLPDPFDNRRPFILQTPAEDDRPQTGTVHPPKP